MNHFQLNQQVFPIQLQTVMKNKECQGCRGEKTISLKDGSQHECPACLGHGEVFDRYDEKWLELESGRIGKIEIKTYAKKYQGEHRPALEITYMLDRYGVGSGMIFSEKHIFATELEAKAECDRRNNNVA